VTDLPGLFSPLGLLAWYGWNFAVLSSIQLTVRLIRAYSIATTALATLALTLGSLPIALLYAVVLRANLAWYPLAMVLSGLLGFAVAHFLLQLRRLRGRLTAALGTALLSGPWPVFFDVVFRLR
jgi:hypothetical protein